MSAADDPTYPLYLAIKDAIRNGKPISVYDIHPLTDAVMPVVITALETKRTEVLTEAAATQMAFAAEHWTSTADDSISTAGKKDRKYGVAETLASLLGATPVLRPRFIRVLPQDGGFLVRWQVGEESKATFKATRAEADAVVAELWGLADAGKDTGGQAPAGESTQTPPAPDFFQPGRTYTRGRWSFHCLAVAPRPSDGEVRAVGFLTRTDGTCTTESMSRHTWDNDGWAETTEGEVPRG